MFRILFAALLAGSLAACVSPDRGLSLSDVRDLRIVDVIVETPVPDAGARSIVWPRAAAAYANVRMPTSTRPVGLANDPSGPGQVATPEQAAWDARYTALLQSPEARTQADATLVQVVKDSFRKRVATEPAGARAARLKIVIKSLQATSGQARFIADAVVLDGVTGRPLTRYPDLTGHRAPSQAVVPASPIGILIGFAAIAIADQIRGDLALDAIDMASASFAGWLLRE